MAGSRYWQLNDREWLYQKYWIEWLSLKKIANEISCSVHAVVEAFKRNSLKTRSHLEVTKGNKYALGLKRSEETKRKMQLANIKYPQLNDKNWLHEKHLGEQHTMSGIGKILGCHRISVSRALKRHNIEIRSQCGRPRKLTPAQRRMNCAMSRDIRASLKGTKSERHWENIVGYVLPELMQTLEKEFRQGMTWDNYGKWHLDHMIPLAHFTFNSTEDPEFKKAWSLGNLQPLWKGENLRKGAKFMFF